MIENTINDDKTIAGGIGAMLAGRYHILRRLGQGGMGSVWLAEDRQLDNRKVAIKMLPSIVVTDKRAYQQLKSEALVSLKLVHPNIVTLRAFEENNGAPFLVMDYVEGQTLSDYLSVKGKLSEAETIKLLKPIAAALDYAHSEKVIHRDVKPSNIIIRKDGHPFILDFGIAREIQESMTRVTGRTISGTLLYMSPEQLRGAPPAPAQDVYSFSVMAYECLKGEPPFTRGDISYQIVNERPVALMGDTQLVMCVMAGLAKTPASRPRNCVAVIGIECSSLGYGVKGQSNITFEPNYGEKQFVSLNIGRKALIGTSEPRHGAIKDLILPNGVMIRMIYCAPGSFMREKPFVEQKLSIVNDGRNCDAKLSRVALTKGFWLGKYPITQKQWQSVMKNNPSHFKGDDLPVEMVSWDDCQMFLKQINLILDCGARLPTEAEWEYACRAGTIGAFGGTGKLKDMGWYDNTVLHIGLKTHKVGRKAANAWGFYDMHGNVLEWCHDYYEPYAMGDQVDPIGAKSGRDHVLRGGCFRYWEDNCKSSSRFFNPAKGRSYEFGVRLCCSNLIK